MKVRVDGEYLCFKTCTHTLETINCVFRQYTAPIEAGAGEYNMTHEKRGRAIVLNHEKYSEELELGDRTGTNVDKMCLKQRFEKLKFDVDVFDDLKVADIKEKLYESK